MRDVEHGGSPVPEPPEQREQSVGLRPHQRRGRLVEHEEARVAQEGARDLHDLTLGGAQRRDQAVAVEAKPEAGSDRLLRVAPHPPSVEKRATPRLVPDEQRFRDGEAAHQHRFLVDDMDAERVEAARRHAADLRAADADRAAVRLGEPGQDPDDRRLAGAVLADQAMDAATSDGERGTVERARRAIALPEALHPERRRAHRPPRRAGWWSGRRSPRPNSLWRSVPGRYAVL